MATFIAGATFDYVCHPLRCPRCGRTSSDDCAIDLQTKLRSRPAMDRLRVGDELELRDDLLTGGYLSIRPPTEPRRVIEAWACLECGTSFLWALLELRDGVLASVEPVELDEPTLANVDLVTGEVLALFPVEETLSVVALDPPSLRARIARAEAERLAAARGDRASEP